MSVRLVCVAVVVVAACGCSRSKPRQQPSTMPRPLATSMPAGRVTSCRKFATN